MDMQLMHCNYSHGLANGKPYERYEFYSFRDLEEYFLEHFWGKPGIRSKVIGTVLLVTKEDKK